MCLKKSETVVSLKSRKSGITCRNEFKTRLKEPQSLKEAFEDFKQVLKNFQVS